MKLSLPLLVLVGHVVDSAIADYTYDLNDVEHGPYHWDLVEPLEGNECAGQSNSPIDVPMTNKDACQNEEPYSFMPGDCTVVDVAFQTVKNGVLASFPTTSCESNAMEIPGINGIYRALQYHVHAKSEHSMNGTFYDFELHVVHQLESGDGTSDYGGESNAFAVFGFILESSGPRNVEFQKLLDAWSIVQTYVEAFCGSADRRRDLREDVMKDHKVRQLLSNGIFDIYSLVKSKKFYHYSGGLTTPPCTESVWWNLADSVVIISMEQAVQLKRIIQNYHDSSCESTSLMDPTQGTARPPVSLNGREVYHYCSESNDERDFMWYLSPWNWREIAIEMKWLG